MPITGHNIIAGENSALGNNRFHGTNPRTRTATSWTFFEATAAEVDAAVSAAGAAFRTSRNYPAAQLADFLDRAAGEIEALGDELITTADEETGLGIPRLNSERGRTTNQLRAFGRLLREGSYVEAIIDPAQPERQPLPRPDIRRMLFPIGPVAVFTPNNFPLAFGVAGGDTASVFAAGCPVIVKAHPTYPATCELVAQAISEAVRASGFPIGFFSMLQGTSIDVGQMLVKHPDLRAVGFTGSLRGGRAIFDTAAQRPHPIPVYAEMGSINPMVILPDAIERGGESLVQGLVNSVTLGSGQFCTNPGLIFTLETPQTAAFINAVSRLMAEKAPGVLLNEPVEQGLQTGVTQTASKSSISTLTGGEVVSDGGYCYANTVLETTGEAFITDAELQREHFGPVTLFVVCRSLDELYETIEQVEGNLTGTVHASDNELELADALFDRLREKVGRLILNGFPTGVEVVPAMQHGGPYPATTAPGTSSVGTTAIKRFMRPVAFQGMPDDLLPDALKNSNPLKIWRKIDGEITRDSVRDKPHG